MELIGNFIVTASTVEIEVRRIQTSSLTEKLLAGVTCWLIVEHADHKLRTSE